MDRTEQERLAHKYCDNEMKELKAICYPMIVQKQIEPQYNDELMSLGLKVLWESITSYDETKKCKFSTFLIGNIKREFWTWTRDMERECRCNVLKENGKTVIDKETGRNVRIENIYFDSETDERPLSEIIASDFDVEKEVLILLGEYKMSDKVEEYINSLPKKQQKIARLLSCGYENNEIIEILHMNKKEFNSNLNELRAYEKVKVLY